MKKIKLFVFSLLLVTVNADAGGIHCTLEGCQAICGSQQCTCNPADGYRCGGDHMEEAARCFPYPKPQDGFIQYCIDVSSGMCSAEKANSAWEDIDCGLIPCGSRAGCG